MPKKDKKKKDKKGSGAADTIESVRSAVERALPEGSKERGAQIVDEVARAVTRVRGSLEQHGVLDELGRLRTEVESLARRVANLERPSASTGASRTTAPSKPATTRSRSTASRSTGTRAASSRSTAAKSSPKSTAAKPRSTAAKSSAAKKPAASRSRSSS
jgi:hypothetical protein